MDADYGKQMGKAIRAILDMQDDCIRLFHDLDKSSHRVCIALRECCHAESRKQHRQAGILCRGIDSTLCAQGQ